MSDTKLSIDPDSKVAFHLATPQPVSQPPSSITNTQPKLWPKPDTVGVDDIGISIKQLYNSLLFAIFTLIFDGILAVWTYHDSSDNSLLILIFILVVPLSVHVVKYFSYRTIFDSVNNTDYQKVATKFAHIGWISALMVAMVIITYYEIRISVIEYLVNSPYCYHGTLQAAQYLSTNGEAIFILLHLDSFSCAIAYMYSLYKAFLIYQHYTNLYKNS